MKQIKLVIIMIILSLNQLFAQAEKEVISDSVASVSRLNLGRIEPYWLTVTYDKTTHLIFPSKIKYVDLGSEHIIAGKADEAENVLRIKATTRNFEPETNFSVVTEDGKFYSFDVFYSDFPANLNYDVLKMQKAIGRIDSEKVLLEDLSGAQAPVLEAALREIYRRNKRVVRHIASQSFGITLQLKSIYVNNGKYYLHLELKNSSNVSFPVDFISFKITDKKTAKRTAIQEKELQPLRMFLPLEPVPAQETQRNIVLLDQFTLDDDKMLVIEVFEQNGGRHQKVEVENIDLIHAKSVTDLKLIF